MLSCHENSTSTVSQGASVPKSPLLDDLTQMASLLTDSKSPLIQSPDPILADILEEILTPMGLLGWNNYQELFRVKRLHT